jgi:peptide/nickel transport system permease protein
MSQGDAYIDIVWRQFKKNKPAMLALWLLGVLFLFAIFAPLIASSRPLVFYVGDEISFPWFAALVNAPVIIDQFFNLALLAFFPWLIVAIVWNIIAKRRGVAGRRRLAVAAGVYLALVILFGLIFSIPALRPTYDSSRTFAQEEFENPDRRGIYVLIPFSPHETELEARLMPPMFRKPRDEWRQSNDGFIHLLGTDSGGRDVLVQLIYGTRIAMTIGVVAVSIYVTIGVIVGAVAGYFGGRVDMLISRLIEVIMLFPTFFLILTVVGLLGDRIEGSKIYLIMIVIGITSWPGIARLTRGEVLKQRALEYTTSARALGARNTRIIFRHILPNALAPALVAVPFGIASAIVTEAGLSLLGVGLEPPTPSWGYLLQIASGNYKLWWLVVFPAAAIFITVTVFNLVGSGLRDAMDPRLRM